MRPSETRQEDPKKRFARRFVDFVFEVYQGSKVPSLEFLKPVIYENMPTAIGRDGAIIRNKSNLFRSFIESQTEEQFEQGSDLRVMFNAIKGDGPDAAIYLKFYMECVDDIYKVLREKEKASQDHELGRTAAVGSVTQGEIVSTSHLAGSLPWLNALKEAMAADRIQKCSKREVVFEGSNNRVYRFALEVGNFEEGEMYGHFFTKQVKESGVKEGVIYSRAGKLYEGRFKGDDISKNMSGTLAVYSFAKDEMYFKGVMNGGPNGLMIGEFRYDELIMTKGKKFHGDMTEGIVYDADGRKLYEGKILKKIVSTAGGSNFALLSRAIEFTEQEDLDSDEFRGEILSLGDGKGALKVKGFYYKDGQKVLGVRYLGFLDKENLRRYLHSDQDQMPLSRELDCEIVNYRNGRVALAYRSSDGGNRRQNLTSEQLRSLENDLDTTVNSLYEDRFEIMKDLCKRGEFDLLKSWLVTDVDDGEETTKLVDVKTASMVNSNNVSLLVMLTRLFQGTSGDGIQIDEENYKAVIEGRRKIAEFLLKIPGLDDIMPTDAGKEAIAKGFFSTMIKNRCDEQKKYPLTGENAKSLEHRFNYELHEAIYDAVIEFNGVTKNPGTAVLEGQSERVPHVVRKPKEYGKCVSV